MAQELLLNQQMTIGGRKKMNKRELKHKGMLIGAIAGLILFAIVGLFPSSFIGGVIGLKIAGFLFGMPLSTELLSRTVVGLFMVAGVAITGLIFVGGASLIGWLFGYLKMSFRERTVPKTA